MLSAGGQLIVKPGGQTRSHSQFAQFPALNEISALLPETVISKHIFKLIKFKPKFPDVFQ